MNLQALAMSDAQSRTWAALEKNIEAYWRATGYARDQWARMGRRFRLWREPDVDIAGARFVCPVIEDAVRPLLVTGEYLVIPIHRITSQLHFLGQVTFPVGYPATSKRSEIIAEYLLEYENGRRKLLPVRNGIECAQANCIAGATRISPIATGAQPVLQFTKDMAREQYQILSWSIPLEGRKLATVRCFGKDTTNHLAIFAISTEEA